MSFVHIAEHMQDRDDFHFILAGDGYLGKTLKEYIKHNNIDNIRFTYVNLRTYTPRNSSKHNVFLVTGILIKR